MTDNTQDQTDGTDSGIPTTPPPPPVDPTRPLHIKTAHSYDPVTGQYTGDTAAYESPLEEGVFLVPANATLVDLPSTIAQGYAAVFDATAQTWSLMMNLVGTPIWSTSTGEQSVVDALGSLPTGYTMQPPMTPRDKWTGTTWASPSTPYDTWNGTAWITNATAQTTAQWAAVRTQRNGLLAGCDWTVLPDVPMAAPRLAAWKTYRQALRDVPQTQQNPAAIAWPAPPA